MTLTVQIDEGACLAHGDCEHVAPHVFRVTDVAELQGPGTDERTAAPPPGRARRARSCCSTRQPARRLIRNRRAANISVRPTEI